MTSSSNALPYAGRPVAPQKPIVEAPRRGLLGQALYDTFGQVGAKVGSVWIVILAVVGVFAPFLASSHPLVFRSKGGALEFPLLAHLHSIDIIVIVLFVHAAF